MSPKATSAERQAGGADAAQDERAEPAAKLGMPVKLGVAVAYLGGLVLLAMRAGTGPVLLLLAAGALLLVIWSAFRAVQGVVEPAEEIGSLAAKTTQAEAWKKAALKAIKDLEYERAIGNVSDADYAKLLETYREEAKRALRAVDDERQARREAAAEWIAEHLTGGPGPEARDEVREERDEAPGEPATEAGEDDTGDDETAEPTPTPAEAPVSKRELRKCPKCDTRNEPDAKFCKECAASLPRGGA